MPGIFKFRTVAITLLLLALGYVALWYTVGFRIQKAMTATLSGWLDRGLAVDHGAINLSGFPYRLVLEIDGLRVATRERGLGVAGNRLTLVSHLWTPDHWIAQIEGAEVTIANGAIAFEEDFVQASYRLHDGDKLVIKLDSAGAQDMRLQNPEGVPQLEQWSLLLGKDYSEPATQGGLYEKRTLEFRFFAQSPGATLELAGGVSGPALGDWTRSELGAWRDEGGLLEVDELTWRTPNLVMTANGDVTLDNEFKPLGSATLNTSDWAAAAKTLRPYGILLNRSMPEKTALMMQNGSALVGDAVALNLPAVVKR